MIYRPPLIFVTGSFFFRSGQIEEIVKTEHLKDVQSEYARKLLQMIITF